MLHLETFSYTIGDNFTLNNLKRILSLEHGHTQLNVY